MALALLGAPSLFQYAVGRKGGPSPHKSLTVLGGKVLCQSSRAASQKVGTRNTWGIFAQQGKRPTPHPRTI